MFRNPRENRKLPGSSRIAPSAGRPPSPLRSSPVAAMPARTAAPKATTKAKAAPSIPKKTQTTLVAKDWSAKSAANNGKSKTKPQAASNGNIMAFFKKAEDINNRIFLQERGSNPTIVLDGTDEDVGWSDEMHNGVTTSQDEERHNENGGSCKRRRLSDKEVATACSPPPPEVQQPTPATTEAAPNDTLEPVSHTRKRIGPFVDDSDSDEEEDEATTFSRRGTITQQQSDSLPVSKPLEESHSVDNTEPSIGHVPPLLDAESTLHHDQDETEDFDGLEDDELLEGEEYDERRWMKAQIKLEMQEAGFEGDPEDFDPPSMFPDDTLVDESSTDAPSCPICDSSLRGLSEQESSVHVNACLDGKPIPLPTSTEIKQEESPTPTTHAKAFKRPPRPAKEGQADPFQLGQPSTAPKSAFSKLMASHAEDAAWATAAAAQNAARGKPAYERTCPFYKILPGLYICVDAFRYGAVKGQSAYFLSHFHSDHYVGLTASWSHGPIYCSKVTGNLVRQQLRVDSKWVVDLDFEKKTEVPGTDGVHVTMISANHCPGSSLFLFEKEIGKGSNPKLHRVLHCGDFRACQAHIEHPLLRPDVMDTVSGVNKQQKLDVCYLDTTYLTPKYAFPPQQQVIQACADMCVSLSKQHPDDADGWEKMKRERAGAGMTKFIRKDCSTSPTSKSPERGRLLVVVGTYSIGKERICVGIAKALGSLIYAPPNKQRICRALEDDELNALLTTDPRKGQVHMTPLFEIRADTLDDYLRDFSDTFSRAVGFRPSGWNYRPPNTRFTESPAVSTVLHSASWKSAFGMKDLTPQRGSTRTAACYGVPYSEHSSFRELTMFCCALRIDRIIPTVNVGSAKSRERMKAWCEKWEVEKRKNGLYTLGEDGWC
jgi:DNA cross-link repair 1A protein